MGEGKAESGEIAYTASQGQGEVSLAAAGPLLARGMPRNDGLF